MLSVMEGRRLDAVIADVRDYWARRGLIAAPFDLTTLHPSVVGRLPADYQRFVLVAGVPLDNQFQEVRFWEPGELRLARDYLVEAQVSPGDWLEVDGPRILIFADYFQESWWYGLWLDDDRCGLVSRVGGGNDPEAPLGSFSQFLDAYMRDAPALYGPD